MKLIKLLFCFFVYGTLWGQNTFNPEVTSIAQIDDKIEVFYDLDEAAPGESFRIWVKVYDINDQEIPLAERTGAVGDTVLGGAGKRVLLSLREDFRSVSTELYVRIFARPNFKTKIDIFTKERLQVLLKSVICPGWGQAGNRPKKGLLFLGLAAYGALGGSVLYNRRAEDKYAAYGESESLSERNRLFEEAKDSERSSDVLFYGAATLWAGNIIWAFFDKIPEEKRSVLVAPILHPSDSGFALIVRF